MSKIADTIKSLKPGDRVRVTFEDEVHMQYSGGIALISADVNEDVITSIEVIERPFQVGDEVFCGDCPRGVITAMDATHALCRWPDRHPSATPIKDLRRAS